MKRLDTVEESAAEPVKHVQASGWLTRLWARVAWALKIGWEHEVSTGWLHSISHKYKHQRTGEVRWHHEDC